MRYRFWASENRGQRWDPAIRFRAVGGARRRRRGIWELAARGYEQLVTDGYSSKYVLGNSWDVRIAVSPQELDDGVVLKEA